MTNFSPLYSAENFSGEVIHVFRFANNYGASVAVGEADSNMAVIRFFGEGDTDFRFVEDQVNNPVLAKYTSGDNPTITLYSEEGADAVLTDIEALNPEGHGETEGYSMDDVLVGMISRGMVDVEELLAALDAALGDEPGYGLVDDEEV
jgi:hypothetical protein